MWLFYSSFLLLMAGILILMGGIWNSENLVGTGFGIGLAGCGFAIWPSILSITMYAWSFYFIIGELINLGLAGTALVLIIIAYVKITSAGI